jgi:hypothetical protein
LENHDAAQKSGSFAGNARRRLEKMTGEKVVSLENFLPKQTDETAAKLPEVPPQ